MKDEDNRPRPLTPEEIDELRKDKKEGHEWARKALEEMRKKAADEKRER